MAGGALTSKLRITIGAASSALSIAAGNLTSGSSAAFARGTAHGLTPDQLAWNAIGYHDVVHGLVHVMGRSPLSNPYHTYYDIANDAWSNPVSFNDGDNFGHIYAGFTIDPATGDLFYQGTQTNPATGALHKWPFATKTWGSFASGLFTGGPNWPNNGVGWHPNLFGAGSGGVVVATATNGSNMGYSFVRGSDAAISRVNSSIANGDLYGQSLYFGVIGKLIQGSNGGGPHALISGNQPAPPTAPSVPVSVGAPPIDTKADSTDSGGTAFGTMIWYPKQPSGNTNALWDPILNATDMMIVQRGTGGSNVGVWRSTDGDTWVASGTHPFTSQVGRVLIALGGGLNCLWEIGESNGTKVSRLWKVA